MLQLTHKEGESILIDRPSLVTVVKILGRGKVRLGIEPVEAKDLTEAAQKAFNKPQTTQRQ